MPQKSHPNVFLSLSSAINARSHSHKALIKAASPDRILVESDIHRLDQCAGRTWDMILTVADVHGWKVEDRWSDDLDGNESGAVHRLEENWKRFSEGDHSKYASKGKKKRR